VNEACRHATPVEEVATVHDEVDLLVEGRVEDAFEVRKEVVTSAAALNARPLGQIETEMRVG
jgi:hypothetical protein